MEERDTVYTELCALGEAEYAAFSRKLTPGIDASAFLGVRVPKLRAYAKELRRSGRAEAFLNSLPHKSYDENLLHSVLLGGEKPFDAALAKVEAFLPYIDNWAVCDTLRPAAFKKDRNALLERIRIWLKSDKTYTVRFAVDSLMAYYLDDAFDPAFNELAAGVTHEDYYVRMMVAWYFATALAKQWDATIPYIEEHRLPDWTHKKTIQKAIESYRITEEQKAYLRTLREVKA